MPESTVKWFDAKKGYGFINHPDDGDDVFVHYTQIQTDDDFKTLRTGQTVAFEMNDGPKGLHAAEVVPLAEEESTSPGGPPDAEREHAPPAQHGAADGRDLDGFRTADSPPSEVTSSEVASSEASHDREQPGAA